MELIKCFKSIKENAFVASDYPVVITLEDHLTPDLQAKVAEVSVLFVLFRFQALLSILNVVLSPIPDGYSNIWRYSVFSWFGMLERISFPRIIEEKDHYINQTT